MLVVGWIEQHHVFLLCLVDIGDKTLVNQTSVWFEHTDAGTWLNVLEDHVLEQDSFPRTDSTKDVHVTGPALIGDPDGARLTPVEVFSQHKTALL